MHLSEKSIQRFRQTLINAARAIFIWDIVTKNYQQSSREAPSDGHREWDTGKLWCRKIRGQEKSGRHLFFLSHKPPLSRFYTLKRTARQEKSIDFFFFQKMAPSSLADRSRMDSIFVPSLAQPKKGGGTLISQDELIRRPRGGSVRKFWLKFAASRSIF